VVAAWGDMPGPDIACPSSPVKEIAMRVVKAAAVQVSPVLYSREGTVEKVVRKIQELGHQGVQFATFPETVVPYYPYFSFVQPPYQNIVGAPETARPGGDSAVSCHQRPERG
jgi:carbon-nitrogen hydrolase